MKKSVLVASKSYTVISILDTREWPEIAVDFFEKKCGPIIKRLIPGGEVEVVNIEKWNRIEIRRWD